MLWVLGEALCRWDVHFRGKLVLVRMGDATAVTYANFGAGGPRQLTQLARRIRGLRPSYVSTVVALYIAGRGYSVADALSRFSIEVAGGGPLSDRDLRSLCGSQAEACSGKMDVDMLASDDGVHAWGSLTRRSKAPSRKGGCGGSRA